MVLEAPAHAGIEVARQQRGDQRAGDHKAPERRRRNGHAERGGAGEHTAAQADAADDKRQHEHGVERDVERGQAADELTAAHARVRHGPRGERDPAGPGRREDACGGHSGHGDLIAGAPAEP
jgi:hypothetical protein